MLHFSSVQMLFFAVIEFPLQACFQDITYHNLTQPPPAIPQRQIPHARVLNKVTFCNRAKTGFLK